jgi:hypothetical protein
MFWKYLVTGVVAAVTAVTGTTPVLSGPRAAPHPRGGRGFHPPAPHFRRFDRREDRFERRFPLGRFDRREDRLESRFRFGRFDRREDRFERLSPFRRFDRREDRFEKRFPLGRFDRREDRLENRSRFGQFDRRENHSPGDGRGGSWSSKPLAGPYAAYGEQAGWSFAAKYRTPPGKTLPARVASRPSSFTYAAYGEKVGE